MEKRTLRRQMAVSASAMVVGVLLVNFVANCIFYMYFIDPAQVCDQDSLVPTGVDLAWLVATTVLGLIIVTPAAVRLSRRIVAPLDALADAIRAAAAGDLGARAEMGGSSFGETSSLLSDYNRLAERMQRTSNDMTTWNAAIAHELRTPVAILRGRLQGLAEGVFEAGEQQFLNLLRQVEGLSRLIDDLRVVSLAEGGQLRLQKSEVRIDREVMHVVDFVEPTLVHHHLVIDPSLVPVTAVCDPVRLRQALLAILDNAQRYAVSGPVHIAVERHAAHVELRVEDTGPGIDETLRDHVFDNFRRGEASRSRSSGGSGLGLAVVRSIALAHHGSVKCVPSRFGGTCIQIVLPRDDLPRQGSRPA